MFGNRTFRATAAFALSGAAFAVGNLLLARTIPVSDYGRAALESALLNLFTVIGPLGLDQVLLRRTGHASWKLFGTAALLNTAVGFAVAAVSVRFYSLPFQEAVLLGIAIVASGTAGVASAGMRAQGRDTMPLIMVFGTNSLILLCGLYGFFGGHISVPKIMAVLAGGNVVLGAAAWIIFRRGDPSPGAPLGAIRWREAISLLGLVMVGALAIQLERLILPKTLGTEALAVFSVLSSVAIFPFRLVTSGAGFSLAPQLRAAESFAARKTVVIRELGSIVGLLSMVTLFIVAFAPLITSWITDGRYELGRTLVLVACASGAVKVIQALFRTVVIGCGSPRAIVSLNAINWIAIGVSILSGIAGSHWGLTGLILGMAMGSLVANLPALVIALRALRSAP